MSNLLNGNGSFAGVLFDLDGTLVDTAPDMVATLHHLQTRRGEARIDYDLARSHVSNGAGGLVKLAFADCDDADLAALLREFLAHYQRRVSEASQVFPGLEDLLDVLDRHKRPWGVVTNKPQALTDKLLASLGLMPRLACAVSGDTLPQRKPHPAPMLLASKLMSVEPEQIVYVGDAARDVEAGHAAGMTTIGATWGYITADDDPATWNADALADTPKDLARLLLKELG